MYRKFLGEELERNRTLRQAKLRSDDNIKNIKESVRALSKVISLSLFI
jgi:hypothetical protein